MHLMSDPQDVPLTTTRLLLEPLVVAHAQSLYPLRRMSASIVTSPTSLRSHRPRWTRSPPATAASRHAMLRTDSTSG